MKLEGHMMKCPACHELIDWGPILGSKEHMDCIANEDLPKIHGKELKCKCGGYSEIMIIRGVK